MVKWPIEKLGTLCEIKTGRKDVNQGNPEGKYPFFTCAKEHTYSDDYSFDGEALLIAGNGDVGNTTYYNGKFEAYQRTYVLMNFDRVNPRYLFRILDGLLKRTLYDQKLGNTMPYIKKGMLENYPIILPPLSMQKRIVAILDEAFAGIDTAIANTDRNLANARELFESYLSSVFTRRGDGWEDKTLGEIAGFKNGLNFNKHSNGQTLPVIGVGDFQKNQYVPIKNLGLATIDGTLDTSYEVKKDDILTVRSNGSKELIGRCMLVPEVEEQTSFSGFVIRIRFDTARIVPKFLLWFMKSNATVKQLTREGGGANINNINQKKLSALPVSYPSSPGEQLEMAQKLDELSLELERLESIYQQKLNSLIELKQSLLQKAISGELPTEGDKLMDEAVA
ncbi:hypothetical protein BOW53_10230 [Solemya pervernicosa gill symbiont]|uniref:Type I restriction modification DNA specificity domain-containing protein n=1 Tax=Solemya pervernicosa gill symbiont TaxID=642797 RepID=A0A1T2L466_9GAMM|nr:restriction endonuclease subunit S [Solemya pervernicosa gill symbiont]OOZ39820.1 hypothetical protein BOW53_10230 [Solemya pervernicosa gill symbiont]